MDARFQEVSGATEGMVQPDIQVEMPHIAAVVPMEDREEMEEMEALARMEPPEDEEVMFKSFSTEKTRTS